MAFFPTAIRGSAQKLFSLTYHFLEVLGVRVNILKRNELTNATSGLLQQKRKGWISYVNVHAINLASELPWFKSFLNDSLLTYCDGQGVRLGASLLHGHLPQRIVMTDWVYDICGLAAENGWKIYFLGSKIDVVTKTIQNLRDFLPSLLVSGYHHGYLNSSDSEAVVEEINRTGTDIVVVGMGMPLQERWILDNSDRINASLLLNAGSCFDYVSGAKQRCPRWLGNIGFEWVFRLLQEPRRLWKRYLIGNPEFLYNILKQRFERSR